MDPYNFSVKDWTIMMKKHLIFLSFFLLFVVTIFLTSCETVIFESNSPDSRGSIQTVSSATAKHLVIVSATIQPSVEHSLGTSTPSPESTKTPRNTQTESTNTQSPDWEIPEGIIGTIFYQLLGEKNEFIALNLGTGFEETLSYPKDCERSLLPNPQSLLPKRTDILCKTEDRIYLFNLISQEEIDIPIKINSPEWILGSSANGSHIFALETNLTKDQTIHLYNVETEDYFSVEVNLPISHGGGGENPLINIPALSADGKNLAFIGDEEYQDKLVIYSLENGNILIPTEKAFASGIQWAPKSQKLVFGIREEPFIHPGLPEADKFLLYDTEERKLIELPLEQDLITFDFFTTYQETIWSPDESYLLISGVFADLQSAYVMPCIISTKTLLIGCNNDPGGIMGWSPDGKHWALSSVFENSLRIYSGLDNADISFYYEGIYSLAWR